MFFIYDGYKIYGGVNVDKNIAEARGFDAIFLNIDATDFSLDFSGINALLDARHEDFVIRQGANHSFH